jgi:hypoxanthine phosphoribosyltransferase
MPDYKILYSEQAVSDRITAMAADIVQAYANINPLFVCLLNGGLPFASKLISAIQQQAPGFHPDLQTMLVSTYGSGRQPGKPRLVTDLPPDYRDLVGRHIILLDDLIDGGATLSFAKKHLFSYGARAIDCIVLVKKLKTAANHSDITMFGFEAPDVWLTGMGMDDARLGKEANRWAQWIAIASQDS